MQIPGIAAVGPQLKLDLSGDIEIAAELDFSYGFELIVSLWECNLNYAFF